MHLPLTMTVNKRLKVLQNDWAAEVKAGYGELVGTRTPRVTQSSNNTMNHAAGAANSRLLIGQSSSSGPLIGHLLSSPALTPTPCPVFHPNTGMCRLSLFPFLLTVYVCVHCLFHHSLPFAAWPLTDTRADWVTLCSLVWRLWGLSQITLPRIPWPWIQWQILWIRPRLTFPYSGEGGWGG